jgi:hypothetical protein
MQRFGIWRELAPCYIGPFMSVEKCVHVAY